MPKSVVFFVHGMGQHNKDWISEEQGPATVLAREATAYPGFDDPEDLHGATEFVEIRYDDIFERILGQWANLASDLEGKLPQATPEAITRIGDWLSEVDEPDNWFASHALDVALYRGFALVRRLIQLKVASLIMRTVAEREAAGLTDTAYILVAHSLGTTVAHDAVQRMATTNWLNRIDVALDALASRNVGPPTSREELDGALARYGKNPFGPGTFKFEAIFQISNTSRLLATTANGNPYKSVVRPMFSGNGPDTNACRLLVNVDHYLDPISKVRRFRAEEAWPASARRNTARDLFSIRHVHDINVHALDQYLKHPAVHGEILFRAARARFSRDDLVHARKRAEPGGDFAQWGPAYRDEDLQDEIESALTRFHEGDEVKDLAATLAALPGIVEDIRGRT